MLEDILIPIVALLSVFGSLFGIAYMFFSTRHKERMSMIQQGADPLLFATEANPMKVLKWGMFLIGLALGAIVGNWVWIQFGMEPGVAFPAMIFVFGGISLVLFYVIQLRITKNN